MRKLTGKSATKVKEKIPVELLVDEPAEQEAEENTETKENNE